MPIMELTKKEKFVIERLRAEKITGYHLHEISTGTHAGRFYIWPMGLQPMNPVTGKSPVSAAKKFLKEFAPRAGKGWAPYDQPKLRDKTKTPALAFPEV